MRPIKAVGPSLERYSINKCAVEACLRKCVLDLHIDPRNYKVGKIS